MVRDWMLFCCDWRQGKDVCFNHFIQSSIWNPRHDKKARKGNKRQTDWQRRNKLSLFADDMIVYIENPSKNLQNFLELRGECNRFTGARQAHKSKLYFYILARKTRSTCSSLHLLWLHFFNSFIETYSHTLTLCHLKMYNSMVLVILHC